MTIHKVKSLFSNSYYWLSVSFPCLLLLVGDYHWLVNLLSFAFAIHLMMEWQTLKHNRLIQLAFLFLCTLIVEFYWHRHQTPLNICETIFSLKYFYFMFFFIALSFGLKQRRNHPNIPFIMSTLIGVSFFLLFKVPYSDWLESTKGVRPGFGFRNAQHSALVAGFMLMVIFFYWKSVVDYVSHRIHPTMVKFWMFILSLLLFWIVIGTETRAVWLGVITIIVIKCYLYFKSLSKNTNNKSVKIISIITILLAMMGFLIVMNSSYSRFNSESYDIHLLLEPNKVSEQSLTSSGIRLTSWGASLQWISSKPFLGWGQNCVRGLIENDSRLSSHTWDIFGHLHNSFLEMIVAVGILGTLIFLSPLAFVLHQLKGAGSASTRQFTIAAFSFWFVVNLFESYVNYRSGFIVNTILLTLIYSEYSTRQNIAKELNR